MIQVRRIVGRSVFNYQHRAIFINHLPKSGSTWYAKSIAKCLPLYRYEQPSIIRLNHHYPDHFLEALKHPYTVAKQAIDSGTSGASMLDDLGKVIFLMRDPRDILVSYFHMARDPKYSSTVRVLIPEEPGVKPSPWRMLDRNVLSLSDQHFKDKLIDDWFPSFIEFACRNLEFSLNHPERILVQKYEDVTQHFMDELDCLRHFFGIGRNTIPISRLVMRLNLIKPKKGKWKFREGSSGGWMRELSSEQQNRITLTAKPFLELAGYH